MKKKNLLSLGALALSLGLVVSGCSTPGQKGETGETGPQGPQGEPGTPGADGKTYADVIVLNDAVEEGYKVTQDVFAVEVGSDESVTFTFTADEGKPFDVITVVINETTYGPIFASTAEDGTTTATLELTNEQVGNSAQLRRATFATAATYGEDLIDAYHDSIVEKDPQIGHKHDATAEEKVELSKDYEEAIELFAEGYTKAKAGLTTELGKLEDDATVQDKIACADKYLDTAKKTLDDAYAAAVTAAKATAREALDDLAAGVTSTNYKEEDKTAQLTAAKGAVDAATTVAEIVKLVNETEVEKKLEKGTYNKLYSNKSAAFALIDQAIAEVNNKETITEDVVSELEAWGVTVDAIPSKIAEKYYADISAATSFEIDEDGQPELAVKGAQEIKDSLSNLYTELYNAIKNSYLAEIDASKVLATDDQKTVARSVISNAAEDWKFKNEEAKLAKYYGTEDGTLIKALEDAFASLENAQFNDERVVNAKSSAIAKFEEIVNEINKDTGYVAAVSYTVKNGVTTPTTKEYTLTSESKIDNPFFTKTVNAENTSYAVVVPGSISNVEEEGDLDLKDYSVTNWLEALKKDTPENGVLGVKAWEAKHLDDFDAIYGAAKTLYTNSLKAAAVPSNVDLEYITTETISSQFDKAVEKEDFAGILEVAQNTATSREILTTLDDGVAKHVAAVDNFDKGYATYFEGGDSIYKNDFDTLVKDVISGNKGQAEVTNFVNEDNLDAEYQKDVVAYLEDAKVILNEAYQNKITGGTVENYRKVLAVKEAFDGFVGHYVVKGADGKWTTSDTAGVDFRCTTLTSVDHWLNDALASINSSTVTVTNGLTLGVEVGSDPEWGNAADFEVSGSNGNYKATGTAVKLNEEQAASWGANGHVVMINITTSAATAKVRTAYLSSADADFPTNPSDYKTNSGYKEFDIATDSALELAVGIGELKYSDGSTIDYTNTPYLCILELDTEGKVIGRIVIDLTGVELPA